MSVHSGGDSIVLQFEGAGHKPVFKDVRGEPLRRDYAVEGFTVPDGAGGKLFGWKLTPRSGAARAAILHFHGNGGWLLSQMGAILPLVKQNFEIYMFDYSGYGFSEGKATRKNVLRDGLAALTYVRSVTEASGKKLVLYGQSLGGHLAASVAGRKPALIDALVIEGAFSSHKDMARYVTKHAIGLGFAGALLVKELYSGKNSIPAYKGPTLVIHSEEDDVVPFALGKELFEAANEPKEFFPVKKCHVCAPRYYGPEIAFKINAMLNKKAL
jgi:uncharacterized protein